MNQWKIVSDFREHFPKCISQTSKVYVDLFYYYNFMFLELA